MKIAVTSTNSAKLQAVENVFKGAIKDNNIELVSFNVSSGISETPTNDNDAIVGCRNRIKEIISKKGFHTL